MRVFLVMYSSECNDEVVQALERLNLEGLALAEAGPGKVRSAKQKERQLWAGTRTIIALSLAEEREAALFKALQDINETHPDAGVRAFAFDADDVS